jgi:hypothetical protein
MKLFITLLENVNKSRTSAGNLSLKILGKNANKRFKPWCKKVHPGLEVVPVATSYRYTFRASHVTDDVAAFHWWLTLRQLVIFLHKIKQRVLLRRL